MHTKVTSPLSYGAVFVALILLTGLTVYTSGLELGNWHTPVGLAIAGGKALLVALFFMHVLHSSRVTWLVILGALFTLILLIGLTLTDFLTRNWVA
jgi:cytochrome c oxidase subunit IV